MSRDFEMVTSKRNKPSVVDMGDITILPSTQTSRIEDAIADNFGNIVDLVSNIVEIEKMKIQSDAVIKQMEESRKSLLAEAEAYVKKKNADTNSVIQKMQIIRGMMCDFYRYNHNANVSGEDFSRTIENVINSMDKW